MNHYTEMIIKIILSAAQSGLLIVDARLVDAHVRGRWQRLRQAGFIALAIAMTFAWSHYRWANGEFASVHSWEQFHFYLGAKYQKEVGWFDLYKAAWLADRETARSLQLREIRDIATFELVPVEQALVDQPRIRARFTDARWEEFKADWLRMLKVPNDWGRVLQDHGNSNSPAWALIAHPIANLVPLTAGGQELLGFLDLLLMGVMWWFVFRTFGAKVGAVGLFMWATPPIVFEYLSGSFLRWDWLFCLGMALCFIQRQKWATAGAFFGFAVATKLFPLWFGVALGARALIEVRKERRVPERFRRFAIGTVAAGTLAVVLSAAMFGGFWCWQQYRERIQVAQVEKYYGIQYSLKTVYLQVAESSASEVMTSLFAPAQIKQALAHVDIADHQIGFLIARLLFTALILLLVVRGDEASAFSLGPLLVFTWLTVNMYYWNMLALLAIGLMRRNQQRPALGALVGLHVIFMIYFDMSARQWLANKNWIVHGYPVAVMLCVWLVAYAVFEWREIRGQLPQLL